MLKELQQSLIVMHVVVVEMRRNEHLLYIGSWHNELFPPIVRTTIMNIKFYINHILEYYSMTDTTIVLNYQGLFGRVLSTCIKIGIPPSMAGGSKMEIFSLWEWGLCPLPCGDIHPKSILVSLYIKLIFIIFLIQK